MKLWDLAHIRTGDKGNISNVSVTVYDPKDFRSIKEKLTPDFIKEWLGEQVQGEILRYELPQLGALNFVLYDALGGGVTSSTAIDKHGKTLGSYLLDIPF
ncbi:AtuA-related protein [Maribacter sp. CXY002]|uniref:AtuA-related protein n=1 Tax=Maribacter luteocoastalis TaxID=3407671 RepID=UPI003B6811C9